MSPYPLYLHATFGCDYCNNSVIVAASIACLQGEARKGGRGGAESGRAGGGGKQPLEDDGGLCALHHGPEREDYHLQELPRRRAHDGVGDVQVTAALMLVLLFALLMMLMCSLLLHL